jgi:hypothetical protein
MKSSFRVLLPLGVLALLVGAVCVYRGRSEAIPRAGLATEPEIDEQRRAEELEAKRRQVLWRGGEQKRIVEELAVGRCTLLEAASRLQVLYREHSTGLRYLHYGFQANSQEERICRWVIQYSRTQFEDQPEKEAEIKSRLETELQGHLDRGTLRLTQ